MTNTATITITWEDEKGALDFDVSGNLTLPLLAKAGASLYVAALKELRQLMGDRWAGDAWERFKTLVENEVFVYTVRVPRWLRNQEENTDDD